MGSELDVYPPGDWGARPEPTAGEIDEALQTAGDWWLWAVNRSDDCLRSYIDLFERYLSGEVRRRAFTDTGQYSLDAHTAASRADDSSGSSGVSQTTQECGQA